MACELITREFANSSGEPVLVAVRQLAASKALDLHVELVSKLGRAIYPLVENTYNFADIIFLMQQGQNEETAELIKRVVRHAAIDGKTLEGAKYDFALNGELFLSCQIFAFVLEANYLGFFKQGLEINELRRLEAEEASKKVEQQKMMEQG